MICSFSRDEVTVKADDGETIISSEISKLLCKPLELTMVEQRENLNEILFVLVDPHVNEA